MATAVPAQYHPAPLTPPIIAKTIAIIAALAVSMSMKLAWAPLLPPQGGRATVSVAAALVTLPARLDTTTVNCAPESAAVVADVV